MMGIDNDNNDDGAKVNENNDTKSELQNSCSPSLNKHDEIMDGNNFDDE